MVHLGLLEVSGPHRGRAVVVNAVGHGPRPIRGHVGDDLDQASRDMLEGIVVVVEDDDSPVRVVLEGGG